MKKISLTLALTVGALLTLAGTASAMTQAECNSNVQGGSGILVNGTSGVDTWDFSSATLHYCLDGKAGADVIKGSTVGDYILGGGGGDDLYANGGKDVVRGGDGPDHIRGGGDNDNLQGNGGSDFLWGGYGFDLLMGIGDDGHDDYNVDDDGANDPDDIYPGAHPMDAFGTLVDAVTGCPGWGANYHLHGAIGVSYDSGFCF